MSVGLGWDGTAVLRSLSVTIHKRSNILWGNVIWWAALHRISPSWGLSCQRHDNMTIVCRSGYGLQSISNLLHKLVSFVRNLPKLDQNKALIMLINKSIILGVWGIHTLAARTLEIPADAAWIQVHHLISSSCRPYGHHHSPQTCCIADGWALNYAGNK